MFKNFMVVDNLLENPHEVRHFLLNESYYSNEDFKIEGISYHTEDNKPGGFWRGFRTQDFFKKYPGRSAEILNGALSKAIGKSLKVKGELYGHLSTSLMTERVSRSDSWHIDEGNLFAGVVFLTENPGPDSGTWLKLHGSVKKLENKFNRLLMYRADLLHTPGNFFGDTACNSRLTLTFFINTLCIFNK